MAVTSNGRRISIRAKRHCSRCGLFTEQVCYGIRYSKAERSSETYQQTKYWACSECDSSYEEQTEIPAPTERQMLIKRLMKIGGDYDFKSFYLDVGANRVTVDINFYPFDTAHIRRIIYKMEDTGFITVQELRELESAGVRKLKDRERFLMRPLRFKGKEHEQHGVFNSNVEF